MSYADRNLSIKSNMWEVEIGKGGESLKPGSRERCYIQVVACQVKIAERGEVEECGAATANYVEIASVERGDVTRERVTRETLPATAIGPICPVRARKSSFELKKVDVFGQDCNGHESRHWLQGETVGQKWRVWWRSSNSMANWILSFWPGPHDGEFPYLLLRSDLHAKTIPTSFSKEHAWSTLLYLSQSMGDPNSIFVSILPDRIQADWGT